MDTIHDESMRSRREKFGDAMARLNYAREEMEKAFPGANFDPDLEVLNRILLPDANDLHVLAIAVAAQANSVVTYNIRHFPNGVLGPLGLRAETPDEFGLRLLDKTATEVIEGARLHRGSLKRPSYEAGPFLDHLASLDLERTADVLRTLHAML